LDAVVARLIMAHHAFEAAADAIVAGDARALGSLLDTSPDVIVARSDRPHGATLLHYVSANGVEDERQRTPPNVVDIAAMLLARHAVVDAIAEVYGGRATTLALVASSVHPARAGVQRALLQTLLDAGAAIDGVPGGGSPLLAALHNGRGDAAEFLASRGAGLDLESAAGVGRLDIVERLVPDATNAERERAFVWACEYGRNDAVELLMRSGVSPNAEGGTGVTGLHWAVIGGQPGTIQLLLAHGASLAVRNVYGGTALDQARWSATNGDPTIDFGPIIETLIAARREGGEHEH
jgi:ankyrin repeat protein